MIRSCLIEFGADHEGTAWADPDLGRFSEIYNTEGTKYWVACRSDGTVVGGAGIGKLDGAENICELQKMYCIPEARGTGISHKLMENALEYAKNHYSGCYLETLENMTAARKFYEKYGFRRVFEPIGKRNILHVMSAISGSSDYCSGCDTFHPVCRGYTCRRLSYQRSTNKCSRPDLFETRIYHFQFHVCLVLLSTET